MNVRHLGVFVLAAALALGAVPRAWAGAPADVIKVNLDRAVKVLEDQDLKKESRTNERRAAIRKIAEDLFDFNETAKRSLARHWAQRTPAEREQFVALFTDLLERSYMSKIELFSGEKILINGEAVDNDTAVVRTKIVTRNGTEIPVDYRMLKRGDRWLVYDVVIENVSLIANYRAQFNRILSSAPYPELVKKMKANQAMAAAEAAGKH
jgi:phospholipid transport system substrate-binding protein